MSNFTISKPIETVQKQTTSKCIFCHELVPATVVKVVRAGREQIIMRRTCEKHGLHETVISTNARFYWRAEGNPLNRGKNASGGCGCGTACSAGGGKDGFLGDNALNEAKRGTIEKLSTCLALIEIADSCNLSCPTCFADSPLGISGEKLKYHSFDKITKNIQGVIDQKGHIEILQFSGGEPTIHPEFFRLVAWVRSHPKIDYLLINTNGVRLSKDAEFVEGMGRMFKKFDNIQLYLQFDGPQLAGQVEIRGADLRTVREKAIENCQRINLPITLAMTVTTTNLGHLWDTVFYALKYEHIRGVSFQPMFQSGRIPIHDPLAPPITVAGIIVGINEQSKGLVSLNDFTPLPCGDPNCATIGWLFRMAGRYFSPTEFGVDIADLQKKMPDKVKYNLDDLAKCGCENTELGNLMKKYAMKESNAFQLFIKPFMDSRSWDEDRIDRCCTHVIEPNGKLASFCEYYSRRR